MSVNILTANGLVNLSGDKVTKEKIIEVLGYTPADEELFTNIQEDESGNFYITDESGNVIVRVDADGIHSTNVTTNGEKLASEAYVNKKIDEASLGKDSHEHTNMDVLNSLEDNGVGNLVVSDEQGNMIFKIDENGIHSTNVTSNGEKLASEAYVSEKIDEASLGVEVDLTNYATKDELPSKVSDLENDSGFITLDDVPEQKDSHEHANIDVLNSLEDDGEGSLVVSDEQGNVILRIDENGIHSTNVTANEEKLASETYVDEAVQITQSQLNAIQAELADLNALLGEVDALMDDINGEVV